MTTTSLPEATAVTLIRRYSTDPQLDEAAEKLTNCARTFKQYLAAIVGECRQGRRVCSRGASVYSTV